MSIVEREPLVGPDETLEEIQRLPETPEPRTREQILLDAAEIIEIHGWTAGKLERDGQFCLVGAVAKAAFGTTEVTKHNGKIVSAVFDAPKIIGAEYTDIYRVNDRLDYSRRLRPRRGGRFSRRLNAAQTASLILRRVAAGQSFYDAARPE